MMAKISGLDYKLHNYFFYEGNKDFTIGSSFRGFPWTPRKGGKEHIRHLVDFVYEEKQILNMPLEVAIPRVFWHHEKEERDTFAIECIQSCGDQVWSPWYLDLTILKHNTFWLTYLSLCCCTIWFPENYEIMYYGPGPRSIYKY